MKIIEYTVAPSGEYDYAIDVSRGRIVSDPSEFMISGMDVYFGDWIDKDGHYRVDKGPCLYSREFISTHSNFPEMAKSAISGQIPRVFYSAAK